MQSRLRAARQQTDFGAAIADLADMLDSAQARIDYGQRRDVLRNWVINSARCSQLISGLHGTCSPRADLGERKRMLHRSGCGPGSPAAGTSSHLRR